MLRLMDKVAVITGGVNGIGKAAAERFAAEGARVILWDVNEKSGVDLEQNMLSSGFKVKFFKTDVSNFDEVTKNAGESLAAFGKIDILVNNAGITRDATLKKMDPADWQKVIDINLTGVFNCTKVISSFMLEKQYGRIINTSSVVGLYGNFGQSNYVAAKSGVIGMTKVWARELGRKGITVNAVAPGFIETEMVKKMPENVLAMMREKTPLGRLGTPEDIASAYLFLASDEASYVNGAVLSVDGGIVI
ncbi:MAG: 3-oxoacyl-ACP reductase FabG [Ignavibacteriales bacterium]|nr:3-oxoacyl-ACP reductase FabG [Ignavibacteriales bacterium]MCF8316157.1 3-oxoacyl-ACP reductase FabG [Ignavibacteriales bacterium]MCF8436659.1 3-oxoacyl-ACP reductase FabG [Ignavibacteriales bacterium]